MSARFDDFSPASRTAMTGASGKAKKDNWWTISKPEIPIHVTHVSHDPETMQLDGLPEQWKRQLVDEGVMTEDNVYDPRSWKKAGQEVRPENSMHGSDNVTEANSKTFPTRPVHDERDDLPLVFRKLPARVIDIPPSRLKAPSHSHDTLRPHTIPPSGAQPSKLNAPPTFQPQMIPLGAHPPRLNAVWNHHASIENMAQDCGLTFRHREFNEISPSLFEVVSPLGHGSLGVVEEVRVSPKYATFARKRVQIPYRNRKQYLAIINQEAQMLQNLCHSHIIKMMSSYSEGPPSGRQFYSLLMVPVGQRDLRTFLDTVGDQSTTQHQGDDSQERQWLRRWFGCLSSALAYMHSQGVRHQDIKPSNIIHRGGDIYFTDFSSASEFQLGQTTSTDNPARTSRMYAAPEVIDSGDDLKRHGRGTDVFALGAVFTEMLAVSCGASIDEYHHDLVDRKYPSATAARPAFSFGKMLGEMELYFAGDQFFNLCIRNMLLSERDQRPNATEVATSIRNYALSTTTCACDTEVY